MTSKNLKISSFKNLTSTQLYFHGPNYHQHFLLPNSIIYYTTKNPLSSKLYQKLISSCKYFFAKNPIIVLPNLHFINGKWKGCNSQKVVLEKFILDKVLHRLWITDTVETKDRTLIPPSIISNIFRCDVSVCYLFRQTITLKELLFVASSAVQVSVRECDVLNGNNSSSSIVQIETIVANLPLMKTIIFSINPDVSNMSSNSVKKLFEIPNFYNLKGIGFFNAPIGSAEPFDFKSFFEHLKRNPKFLFGISFRASISEAYKNRLEIPSFSHSEFESKQTTSLISAYQESQKKYNENKQD